METAARGAAYRPWDTSGSSQYSFRTSVSTIADIGDEIVEASQSDGELVVEASQAAEDKVFVAVAEELKRGKSALQWALQNLATDGAQVVVAHVHCPAQMIPMSKQPSLSESELILAMTFFLSKKVYPVKSGADAILILTECAVYFIKKQVDVISSAFCFAQQKAKPMLDFDSVLSK
jgi:hypothetical protein